MYKVYEQLSAGLRLLGAVPGLSLTTGPLAKGKHTYDVSAVNSVGESSLSSVSITL
jgi:hypothetical protein